MYGDACVIPPGKPGVRKSILDSVCVRDTREACCREISIRFVCRVFMLVGKPGVGKLVGGVCGFILVVCLHFLCSIIVNIFMISYLVFRRLSSKLMSCFVQIHSFIRLKRDTIICDANSKMFSQRFLIKCNPLKTNYTVSYINGG